MRKESEKEIEQQKRMRSKRNEPSPGSYKFEESFDKTQSPKTFQLKIS
jgi:hypothetical protein